MGRREEVETNESGADTAEMYRVRVCACEHMRMNVSSLAPV